MKNKTFYSLFAAVLTLSMVLAACAPAAAPEAPVAEEPAAEEPAAEEPAAEEPAMEGIGATVANPMGISTEYLNQLELEEFEAQIGQKLVFSENPLFADKGLPPVADRLPKEPLVVMPYDAIGTYGGTLKGASGGMESGTSEIMAWRTTQLVRMGADNATIKPDVAMAWEWNSDNTELTFTLREGHMWSDGTPFTADDVVFYVNDIVGNAEIYEVPWSAWQIGGVTIKAEKIDDTHVTFIFAEPGTPFLYWLATAGSYFPAFAPMEMLKEYHADYNPEADAIAKDAGLDGWVDGFKVYWHKWADATVATEIGLEVPTLESHILAEAPDTQSRSYIANPYYFKVDTTGQQLPYIDMHYERFLDPELITLEVINGNIDQKSQNIPLSNFPIFKENEVAGDYAIQLNDGMIGPVLIFNYTHKDPAVAEIYSDPRFRQAMSVAINRVELGENLFLGLAGGEQAMPANLSYATEADLEYMAQYDTDLANELLDAMGLDQRGADGYRLRADGEKLAIFWEFSAQFTGDPEFAVLIADYWQAVGVDVTIKEIETTLYREKEEGNNLDIAMEWDLPFEYSVISEPRLYTPPWSNSTPKTGAPWVEYWNTSGASGVEPPAWAQRLYEIAGEFQSAAPGSDEYMALGQEMVKLNLENMTIIGTAGKIPQINVVSNRIGNVPQWGINAYRAGYTFSYDPSQWYVK